MKNIVSKMLSFASVVGLLAAGSGCAKISDFGDTNVNPNGATAPITAALLTNIESGLGGIAFGTGTGGTRAALYAQLISETQYTDASLYQLPQLESGGFYSGALNDCQVIINQNSNPATAGNAAQSGSNANQIAIAKIMKAYIILSLTDKWGDMPYAEALQGAGNLAPKYDTQEDIYKAIFQDCRDGIAGFDAGANMKGDIIYGGDQAKWKKLANSLRMIAALRLSKVYPSAAEYPALEFAAAASHPAGFMSSVADNFTLNFPGGAYQNTWYLAYLTRSDFAQSRTLGDVLAALGDTRQSAFGTSAGATFPYGLTRADAVAYDASVGGNYSKVLSNANRAENSPGIIISSATVLLAAAEARERGWITTGSAQTYYNDGVTVAFAQWGLTVPGTYLTTGPANYLTGAGAPGNVGANTFGSIPASQNAATPNALARIALQYWLAAYPNGNEAWANWRRTGVPNLQATTFATNAGGQIPRRYVYGVNEYATNPAQLAIAVGRLSGGDTQDARVWWDKP
jgi:hypothetical protein